MTSSRVENSCSYRYKNIPVPGGGFVTGFAFHQRVPDILYCRTDIGGLYRYDFRKSAWISLIDHATEPGKWETFPLAIALDAHNPSYIYAAVGDNMTNKIAFSNDYGSHWQYFELPRRDSEENTVRIHGNAPGRSTGERLAVDPDDPNTLYLATMQDGLWKTSDHCRTWKKLNVAFNGKKPEMCFTLVEIIKTQSAGKLIIAATNGQGSSPDGNIRGQSVYISHDNGETFKPIDGEPSPVLTGNNDHPGYIAQRAAATGNYLYITYAAYNVGFSNWKSCGCDLGLCHDGIVFRYEFDEKGIVREALDLTPKFSFNDDSNIGMKVGYGFSGIAVDRNNPGTLICSTICRRPDVIFHSTDYGMTWTPILSGLDIGKIDFKVSYMRPEYSGLKTSCVHWPSDLKINPFNSNMAVFNTGIGVFITNNLLDAKYGKTVNWETFCDGIEETVHLNVYSPPSGDVKVIDIIGDYGGFVFSDLDKPAENTFADSNHDRWITAMNADFPDSNPQLLIATPRGNWTGETKGGLIISHDQGKNWTQVGYPSNLSKELDEEIEKLKKPNVTSGWAAISADGKTIVWTVGSEMKSSCVVYSRNFGDRWEISQIYNIEGKKVEHIPFKVISDRVNSEIFYGFSSAEGGARIFASTDGGASFRQLLTPDDFPNVTLSGIDSEEDYEIRVESGKEGTIYVALRQYGLWKLTFDKTKFAISGRRITKNGDYINRIGIGKPKGSGSTNTLFTSGTIGGVYGFWRSIDGGETWLRINDDRHQFGDIRSISGDPRIFGRVYIATGTRGLIYGDPV